MIKAIRRFIDSIFMTDHEWKKKHCPTIHWWLFEASEEDKQKAFEVMKKNADRNYRDMLLGAGHTQEVATRHMKIGSN